MSSETQADTAHPSTVSPSTEASPTTGHLVIIGNGMAAHRLVSRLKGRSGAPSHITLIGAEPHPAYNRILLSSWLAGDIERESMALSLDDHPFPIVGQRLGTRVVNIDRRRQRVECGDGEVLCYDHLVLATGSRSAMPEIPGIDLEGVHGFRDLDDAARLAAIAEAGGTAVVVGGGLLGLEAAAGLAGRGMQVSVVQRSSRVMNRQLDAVAASMLATELGQRGITLHTGARLDAIIGDHGGKVSGVRLSGQPTALEADCVVIAAGITPNIDLGQAAGLHCDRAIHVDDGLATSDPRISAVGECCQFGDSTYGLVEPIWRQVEILAARLSGEAADAYSDKPCATKLKVSGVDLYAFGPTEPDSDHEVLSYHDTGEYRRLLLRDGKLEGAVLYGDTRMGPWLFSLAEQGTCLDRVRHSLLLGQADTDALLSAHAAPHSDSSHHQDAA
ncbi:FAD-dependent oxidoreductase [Halomonas sp. DP8Y7-3]|uniref:NAD(P)/FAD-dependent oxidoreductase n=1 Tax=Halomonas sp. DP8Y7-3 TaxID=2859079 RepID=UPI001C97AC9D|nr:FAD-dependent oxidoreductase [Halomonas sp. DP8Y7-3]MBY5928293.1 FAD-dependent oxidoreductase [Halomonas sp. DP8Y7-3]